MRILGHRTSRVLSAFSCKVHIHCLYGKDLSKVNILKKCSRSRLGRIINPLSGSLYLCMIVISETSIFLEALCPDDQNRTEIQGQEDFREPNRCQKINALNFRPLIMQQLQ